LLNGSNQEDLSMRVTRVCRWALAALVTVAIAAWERPADAQVFTGRIDVTVVDSSGGVVPGAIVQVNGPQEHDAVADEQGEAHFLNLAPGTYTVRAALAGFADYLNQNVPVSAGTAVTLRAQLGVSGVTEQVSVAAETPVIDVKNQIVGTSVTLDELQNIPTARDPWVVLQTVPGVVVDRVNVGGSESGQQSNYVAKGASTGDNTWNIDGIPITDMAALGSSPTYYDFDMFQEMQITTGGADVQASTPGVQLNFVLKSGSNTPRGGARVFYTGESLQGNNLPDELKDTLGGETGKGNRMDRYADYGADFGGPIVRDRWWAWGSYAKTDVRVITLSGDPDKTTLENASVKTSAQFTDSWRGSFTYFRGNKVKDGRGAGPLNPQETTFDQDGPSDLFKGEVNFVAGNNLFLAARGAKVGGVFNLEPKGGRDKQAWIDASGVARNTNQYYETDRPQSTAVLEGNYFRGRHEIKFGGSFRHVEDVTNLGYGNGWLDVELDAASHLVLAIPVRPFTQENAANYSALYLGDTLTFNRLTANLALRYDRTTNSALESSQPAHPDLPDVLPAVTAPTVKDAVVWNTLSPRVGASYALDDSRKTLVRGSYASFASQMNVTEAGAVSAASFAYAYYLAIDANTNRNIEADELVRQVSVIGVDPVDPLKVVNQINPDIKAPRTHELVFGVDRELASNLGASASFTWRRSTGDLWSPLIGVTTADYALDGVLEGSVSPVGAFAQEYYALNEDAAPEGGGYARGNREGYHRRFRGFELALTKRLANRWMGRAAFSWNDEREYFDDPALSIQDPTPTTENPLVDGGEVTRLSAGSSKSEIYLTAPKYQIIANGYFQGPGGVNLGGNLLVRQGFGMPFYGNDVETSDPIKATKDVLVVGIGDYRLPTLTQLDLRAEKEFRIGSRRLMFDVDLFNVLNSGTTLGRQYDVQASDPATNDILEIMNPRILRFGVRLNF
jgi:hypothetical protein